MAIDKINFDGIEIEIPRKTSQLTNDNNFITLSDIPTASNATLGLIKLATIQEITDGTNETNAVTPKQLKTAIEGIGTVFDLKGSVDTFGDLPTENNEIGDVWYVKSESVGYIWLNDGTENRWEQLGPSINLSNYVQITDIVNDLTTDDIEKPLSAYQGKVLNESILNVSQSIPTNTSQLTNDSGYITGYTETDPTVPDWAKQSTKPTYAYSEITEKPTLATVATSGSYNDLTNKPNIPSEVTVDSALSTTSENAVQNKVVTSAINTAQTTADTANTNAQNAQSTAETALASANGAVSKNTEQDTLISALQTAKVDKLVENGDYSMSYTNDTNSNEIDILLKKLSKLLGGLSINEGGAYISHITQILLSIVDTTGTIATNKKSFKINANGIFLDNVAIIESDTNSNGWWVRFYDGTQICIGKNLRVGGGKNTLFTLPMPFIDTEYTAVCSFFTSANYSEYCSTNTYEKTTLKIFNSNGATIPVNYIAIGKWK